MECPLDLGAKLRLDFLEIGVVVLERLRGGEEKTLGVNQCWNRAFSRNRTPSIVLPLRIERQVNANGDFGMSLQDVYALLIPGRGKHHRYGNGQSRCDQSLDRHVHAVTHSCIVTADDQIGRSETGLVSRVGCLTEELARQGAQRSTRDQQG